MTGFETGDVDGLRFVGSIELLYTIDDWVDNVDNTVRPAPVLSDAVSVAELNCGRPKHYEVSDVENTSSACA